MERKMFSSKKRPNIGIIGGGSWGTAIGLALYQNNLPVTVFEYDAATVARVRKTRVNRFYLPSVRIPEAIGFTNDLETVVTGSDILVLATPTKFIRSVLALMKPWYHGQLVVNLAKGIEQGSLKLISGIFTEVLGRRSASRYMVLTGPSHAEEVAAKRPTSVVAVSRNLKTAEGIQQLFSNRYLRVYTGTDVAGAELGGALKNIIAIAAGICEGLKLGDNATAALVTRGIVEIARLGQKLGGKKETFSGLTGIGDLMVTCYSGHSRNRTFGSLIASGLTAAQARKKIGQVVEGAYTVKAAYTLARGCAIQLPITEEVYNVVYKRKKPVNAVKTLMTRLAKPEFY